MKAVKCRYKRIFDGLIHQSVFRGDKKNKEIDRKANRVYPFVRCYNFFRLIFHNSDVFSSMRSHKRLYLRSVDEGSDIQAHGRGESEKNYWRHEICRMRSRSRAISLSIMIKKCVKQKIARMARATSFRGSSRQTEALQKALTALFPLEASKPMALYLKIGALSWKLSTKRGPAGYIEFIKIRCLGSRT